MLPSGVFVVYNTGIELRSVRQTRPISHGNLRNPKDRIPISAVPRDEIPFSHLYLDVIGPLFDKAEYNYCLCIIDSCTRYPFAIPLRSVTAKAVCEALVNVFAQVGVSSVITSDQGSCFAAELTQQFLNILGCSPRW